MVGIPTPLKNDGVSNSWDDEIPKIWKVIKFHGSSHHQPDRFRFNPLTSSLLVRFIMLYYISQSLHITNHQPVKDIWIAPSISRKRETPGTEASGFLGSFCHVSHDY